MNNDLISRSELLAFANNHVGRIVDCNDIARFPAVDAEPVRHGWWIINSELEENILEPREYDEHFYAICSECGRTIYLNDYICITGDYEKAVKEYPYCHCGAKMDGQNTPACKCATCQNDGWDMPQCRECNEKNGFKWYVAKKDGGAE